MSVLEILLDSSDILQACGDEIREFGEPFKPGDGHVRKPEQTEHVARETDLAVGFGGTIPLLDRFVEVSVENDTIRLDAYSSQNGEDPACTYEELERIAKIMIRVLFHHMHRQVILHAIKVKTL